MASAESRAIRATFVKSTEPSGRSIAEERADWEAGVAAANADLDARITPLDLGGVRAAMVETDTRHHGVFLFFHGGGYNAGSSVTHRALAARLSSATGMPVVLPDYRLAPEHPFPAAVEDALMAYRALLDRGDDALPIVVGGDSAGGGLAAVLLVSLRDRGVPLPRAAVLLSPWLDLSLAGPTMETLAEIDPLTSREDLRRAALLYAPPNSWDDPLVSPLFADLHGLPPTLIQVGQHEVLLSDSERWAERAQAAGSTVELEVWDEMWHVWHGWGDALPEAQAAVARIGEWVRVIGI